MRVLFSTLILLILGGVRQPDAAPAAKPGAARPGSAEGAERTGHRPPSIVLFLVDDLGWRDGGVLGSTFYETPHLDRFAGEATFFTNAYANAPNCAPSRASLLTGLYPPRHGVYTVGNAARGPARERRLVPTPNRTDLDPRFVTIAEALDRAGYASAAIGKWHLGASPREHGFDVNVAGNASGSPRGGHFCPYRNGELADGPDGESLTERLTDEALAFMEKQREAPFLLYLAHYAVHTPIQTTPELEAKYAAKQSEGEHSNAAYAGMVESVDRSFGRVLAKLAELELEKDTLVVFFSDNGGFGPVTSMAPLRGSKGMLYEGGIRVPLLLRLPGRVPAGRTNRVPVIGTDLFPTLLDVAGVAPQPTAALDGTSLLAALARPQAERTPLFWHFPAYLQADRSTTGPFRTTPVSVVRAGRFKLLEFYESGRRELYDLERDPGENEDLAAREPETLEKLHELLSAWRVATGAPIPAELNPDYDPAPR